MSLAGSGRASLRQGLAVGFAMVSCPGQFLIAGHREAARRMGMKVPPTLFELGDEIIE